MLRFFCKLGSMWRHLTSIRIVQWCIRKQASRLDSSALEITSPTFRKLCELWGFFIFPPPAKGWSDSGGKADPCLPAGRRPPAEKVWCEVHCTHGMKGKLIRISLKHNPLGKLLPRRQRGISPIPIVFYVSWPRRKTSWITFCKVQSSTPLSEKISTAASFLGTRGRRGTTAIPRKIWSAKVRTCSTCLKI